MVTPPGSDLMIHPADTKDPQPMRGVGKKVLLIYPPVRLSSVSLYPPFGLLSLAAVLEGDEFEVEILDLNKLRIPFDEVKRELARREFDIVGIGGMTTVYYYMKLLSLHLKEDYPDKIVVGGGSACSASPEIVLKNTGFDAICIGEGEPIICELMAGLLAGDDISHIPGIWFKDRNGEISKHPERPRMLEISDLPYPAYHLIDMEPYIRNSHVFKHGNMNPLMKERIEQLGIDPERAMRPIPLFSKRGCPFECNFCYRNFGRKVVFSSVDYTLEHMSYLEAKYDTAHFIFADEIFNVSKKWVMEFCEKIKKQKRNYILDTCNGLRANAIDEELLSAMKEAGFCSIGIGIESFHDPTLKAMNKRQTAEQVFDALSAARAAGFRINSAQLLFGYETDGPESMEVNIKALSDLGIQGAGFSIPCPYPGTSLYDEAMEKGLIGDEEEWLMELADRDISERVINMSNMPDRELIGLVRYGTDTVAINAIRKKHPLLGWCLHHLQKLARSQDRDALRWLRNMKNTIQHVLEFRRLPAGVSKTGVVGHEHIREEAFRLLHGDPKLNGLNE